MTSLKTLNLADNPISVKFTGPDWRAVLTAEMQQQASEMILCSNMRVLVLGDRMTGKTALSTMLSRGKSSNSSRKSSFFGPKSPIANSNGNMEWDVFFFLFLLMRFSIF